MGIRATMYGSQKSHYPYLKRHTNEDKSDIDYVLRNDHRIKTTQPLSIILVSFFSEDNVLSGEIKICYNLWNIRVTEIQACRFFGDTRYSFPSSLYLAPPPHFLSSSFFSFLIHGSQSAFSFLPPKSDVSPIFLHSFYIPGLRITPPPPPPPLLPLSHSNPLMLPLGPLTADVI